MANIRVLALVEGQKVWVAAHMVDGEPTPFPKEGYDWIRKDPVSFEDPRWIADPKKD